MNHLTDLQCSMFADSGLAARETEAVVGHLESCGDCRARVEEHRRERNLISTALRAQDIAAPELAAPKFSRPAGLREFALANLVTGGVIWLAQFLWKTAFGELMMTALAWLAIPFPNAYALVADTALYFFQEGNAMLDAYPVLIAIILAGLAFIWCAVSFGKIRALLGMSCLLVVVSTPFAPMSAQALELRFSDNLTIASDETIDDTLILAAENAVIQGNINGDLIAFAQHLVVEGSVSGNLIAISESTILEGEVGGFMAGAGSEVELESAAVAGDLWAAAETMAIDGESRVDGNVTLAAERGSVDGAVGRDVLMFGETLDVDGKIGRNLKAFTAYVNLLASAHVGGDLRFSTEDGSNLHRSPTSVVNGETAWLEKTPAAQPGGRYLNFRFYLRELLQLVSAFLVGLALFWLLPRLRNLTLNRGIEGLKTAGLGLVTLISLPVAMLLLAITVVGLPFTVIGLFLLVLLIYLAKIVLSLMIGRMMLRSSARADSLSWALLTGLMVVFITINLPAIGGVINFLLTVVGVGMLTQAMFIYTSGLGNDRYADE